MRILVTGGAGYIGSHTVAELVAQRDEVITVDNLNKGHREAVLGGEFYKIDLLAEDGLEQVFSKHKIDAVMHFAADCLVPESVQDPQGYYRTNVVGGLNLLKTMLKYRINKIVFSSTAAVYGEPQRTPIKEDDPTRPTNPYGETKLAFEQVLKWYDSAYGLKYVSLRYFNAAGAHPSGKIGEDHQPETHLIPVVLQTALGKREQVEIFGTDYPTPDGTCIRDYIHITDLAQAHLLALEWLAPNRSGSRLAQGRESRIYNLGNGKGFSVKEVIEVARKVTGKKIKVKQGPRRVGDPDRLVASSQRISRELNWRPKYPGLEKIISSAWKWHLSHPDGFGK